MFQPFSVSYHANLINDDTRPLSKIEPNAATSPESAQRTTDAGEDPRSRRKAE